MPDKPVSPESTKDSILARVGSFYGQMRSEADPEVPLSIHTDRYGELVAEVLEPCNRLFNDDLGPGGWDNINRAHFALIQQALDAHRGQGKTILITFGAWHKSWFLPALRERTDITLVDPNPFFESVSETPD